MTGVWFIGKRKTIKNTGQENQFPGHEQNQVPSKALYHCNSILILWELEYQTIMLLTAILKQGFAGAQSYIISAVDTIIK